ncbi:MAG: PAS domain S-box protein [Methylocapsa sp.]|nr:PAS domain S-box protein [Methylocapsa sp.]
MSNKLVEGDDIYRLMVERILDSAIFMLDPDGLVVTWNAGGERILGCCAQEIVGRHVSALYPLEEARSGKPERDLLAAAAQSCFDAAGWRLRKDGSRIWAQVSIRPIRDEDGDLLGFVTLIRDLTDQKRSLDELWRSQDRFQRAVESAPNAMIMINRAGRVVMLNLQAEVLFGYTRDEIFAHPVEKLIPARFRKRHREERIAFFASPQSRPMGAGRDLFALKKDGAEFPVEIGLNVIETDEGPMVLASIVDITARKEHEEALLRSQERFRRAVESAPNAMVIVSHKGRIEMVNLRAEELFGYARGELIGRPVEMVIPERFRGRHRHERISFFANPEKRQIDGRDLVALKKDGTEFPVEISLNPIETEEGTMVLAAIIDITERKRREESLRRSNERFRLVVEAAPSGRIVISRADRIELVNAWTEHILGYQRAELLGQRVDKIIPERFRVEYARIRESFFAAPRLWPLGEGGEFYLLRKDGSEISIEAGLNLIEYEEGPMLIAAIVDITERKRKEERLQAALEERDFLLGEIHHRVKNNLQIVSSVLRVQSANIQDAAAFAVLRKCQDQIQLIGLIHETLRRGNNFARVDFGQLLDSLVDVLKRSYDIDSGRIAVSVAAEPVLLPTDTAIPCAQVACELITNAFKHAFPDGRRGTVTISLVTDAVGIILSITDDGMGLPEDAEMERAEWAGLRLVRLLTEQIGGTLSIRRANPTRFILQFPCTTCATGTFEDGPQQPRGPDSSIF